MAGAYRGCGRKQPSFEAQAINTGDSCMTTSGPALASQIARVCAQAGVPPTMFGKQAINDPGLFGDLKRGRELRQKTLARVHDALAALKAGIAE